MKHTTRLTALAILACSTALTALPAHAAGIDAGSLIENTATATYNVDGARESIDSNTVTIRVDELLDVTIASLDGGAVSSDSGSAVLTFSITNTGNGPEAYDLTADPAVAGNDFDVTIDNIAVDTNGNGVYDDGVDQILGAGESTAEIAADASLTIFVLVTTPTGAADGDTSQVNLTADAATGTGNPGTTFDGQGNGGGDAVVGTTRASDTAIGSLIAGVTTVSLAKTATISDPFGGNQPVPGAIVTYQIVATISGSGSISDLLIADTYPDGTTYQASTLELDAAAQSDAADGDSGSADANGIQVSIGTATSGTTYTVTFDVAID